MFITVHGSRLTMFTGKTASVKRRGRGSGAMKRSSLTIPVLAVALASCGSQDSGRKDGATAAEPTAVVELAKARRCAEQVTVLFWPKGHPSIPSIGFPSLAMPHLEMYRGPGTSYPMSAALAWAFATPPGPSFPQRSTKPDCLSAVSTRELAPVPDAQSSQTAVRLVCRLPQGAQIAMDEAGPERYRFALLDPAAKPAVDGTVATHGSTLSYSPSSCKRTSPPKP
jgi:hypothetical protein